MVAKRMCCGVLTRFKISKRKDLIEDFNLNDGVINEISDFIDISLYNLIEKNDNEYVYALKPEIFNENILFFIKEMYGFNKPDSIFNSNFIERFGKYPFKCEVDEKGEYQLIAKGTKHSEYGVKYLEFLVNKPATSMKVDISGCIFMLWLSENYYYYSGRKNTLRLINKLKVLCCKNKLKKAVVYCLFSLNNED